jgi:hypothetical protein
MEPLGIVVGDKFAKQVAEVPLAEDDVVPEALVANRLHEPLRVGIGLQCQLRDGPRRLSGRPQRTRRRPGPCPHAASPNATDPVTAPRRNPMQPAIATREAVCPPSFC